MVPPHLLAAVVVVATIIAGVTYTYVPDTGWPILTASMVWLIAAFFGFLAAVVIDGPDERVQTDGDSEPAPEAELEGKEADTDLEEAATLEDESVNDPGSEPTGHADGETNVETETNPE